MIAWTWQQGRTSMYEHVDTPHCNLHFRCAIATYIFACLAPPLELTTSTTQEKRVSPQRVVLCCRAGVDILKQRYGTCIKKKQKKKHSDITPQVQTHRPRRP